MGWPDLPPVEAELRLAEVGLSVDGLVRAWGRTPDGERFGGLLSWEAKVRKAFEYFGDQGHPVPVEEAGSVYDRRGPISVGGSPVEPHYVDGELVSRAPAAEVDVDEWPAPRLVRLPPLPEDGDAPPSVSNDHLATGRWHGPVPTFHERGVVGAALVKPPNVTDAMAASGLHKKDVLRAERLHGWGLLRWDGVTLWADPDRVWQRDGRVALRVLAADYLSWLDPLKLPRKP